MADEPISARASGMLVGGSSAIYEIGHWFTLDRQRDALQSYLEEAKSAIRFRDQVMGLTNLGEEALSFQLAEDTNVKFEERKSSRHRRNASTSNGRPFYCCLTLHRFSRSYFHCNLRLSNFNLFVLENPVCSTTEAFVYFPCFSAKVIFSQ